MAEDESKKPHNKRVEQYLIGCLLRDPESFDDAREHVGADQFFWDNHQRIFRAIETAHAGRHPTDAVAIHDRLTAAGGGNEPGVDDYRYLAACRDSSAQPGGVVGHARRVREYFVYREIIRAAADVLAQAHEQSAPAEELAARAEQMFLEVSEKGAVADFAADVDLMRHRLEVIDTGGEPEGLRTGLVDLDRILSGLCRDELILVGARPSQGKTALGLTIGANVARAGTPVLMVSLEMSRQSIGDRLLTMRSGVPMQSFTGTRTVSPEDAEQLAEAAVPPHGSAPLYVYDRVGVTPAEVASVIRRAVRRLNVGLVVVDYIQLIAAANPKANRVEQIADISRALKNAARNAGVPVLALAQLNRAVEGRTDQRPKMSNLREGGSLEQDADKVVLIYHPEPDDPDQSGPRPPVLKVELLVDKNRNGPTGDVTVAYRRRSMRFENMIQGI